MLLVIHNLPSVTRYVDVKNLIQTHCDLSNVILDNLINEGSHKKVTVGVADDADASVIRRKLNGFVLAGSKLKVEELRPKKGPQQQQDGSGSNRGSSRWAPSIPSLMEANVAPDMNPLMSQNSSMSGPNIPMMGQNPPMMGFNPSFMGLNNPVMNQNTMMMGQGSPMLDINSSMMGQGGSMMGQGSSMMGHGSSMMGQSSSMMGQHSSGMGQNNPMNRQGNTRLDNTGHGRGQNAPIAHSSKMGPNNPPMEQFSPFMGQMNSSMGPNQPMLGKNQPVMVPSPLMSNYPTYSAPFYMTPQSNIYGTHSSGQQMAAPLPDFSSQKGNMQSQNSAFPDSGNRKTNNDKSAWGPSNESSYKNKRYSGNSDRERGRDRDRERDMYTRRPSSSSRRSKWDDSHEDHDSSGTRNKSQFSSKRALKPWVDEGSAPYNRNTEFGSFDRSHDRQPDRHSRRHDQSSGSFGPMFRNSMSSGEGPFSGSNYRDNSASAQRRGPSRDDWRERDRFSPPPKRSRPNDYPYHKYGLPLQKVGSSKVPYISLTKKFERDFAWRGQAAAALVKDMFPTIKTDESVQQNVVFNKMKAAVRNRLLVILNNRIGVKIGDQMVLYRRKFKPDEDQYLYDRIAKHLKHKIVRKMKREAQGLPAEEDRAPDNANVMPPSDKPAAETSNPAAATKPPVAPSTGELPKYPFGNKAMHKVQKKNFKEEFKTVAPSAELDDVTKKVVGEEMQIIKEIMLSECVNPANNAQEAFCEAMKKNPEILDETEKMLTLNLAKRILKIGSVPLVRVLGSPKPPRKGPLVEFLKDKGVTSLKKSDRKPLYIATCQSFDYFDKLCALKDVVIDNIAVSFKPMYLTAPPEKIKRKKGQKQPNMPVFNKDKNDDFWDGDDMNEEKIIKEDVVGDSKNIKEEILSPTKNQTEKPTATIKKRVKDDPEKDTEDNGEEYMDHDAEYTGDDDTAQYMDDADFTQDVDVAQIQDNADENDDTIGCNDQADDVNADNFEVNEEDLEDY